MIEIQKSKYNNDTERTITNNLEEETFGRTPYFSLSYGAVKLHSFYSSLQIMNQSLKRS
jgi:hypothetical protein